jgi:cell division protein FtsQ
LLRWLRLPIALALGVWAWMGKRLSGRLAAFRQRVPSPVARGAVYGGLPLLTVIAIWASYDYQSQKTVEHVRIEILTEPENLFLDVPAVKAMLGVNSRILHRPMAEISLSDLEAQLYASSFVKRAEVFFDGQRELVIRLELNRPLARIVPQDGKGWYVGENLRPMPLSKTYTARIPLVRGAFAPPNYQTDSLPAEIQALLPMLRHIYQDPVLRAQISEVVLGPNGDLYLYPEFGDVVVEFGRVIHFDEKLGRLKAFYRQTLSQTGWQYYESISLKYAGQVVARRRGQAA